ncbi:MAG: MFS transporter [Propionibacteriales bacterium]|nr:MFS transporter [Propionibacteriales bacterium]
MAIALDERTESVGRAGFRPLVLVSFAMLIVSMNQYIVVVALPDIGRGLGYSTHNLQAVISAYAIAYGGFLLLGGRAADLLGRRRLLTAGLALFALASFAAGIATTPAVQLSARVAQGIGDALVFPATLALINTTYHEGRARNRALSIWGASGAAGLVVGVLLGGVLTRGFGWSSVFFINVPLATGAIAMAFIVIPKDLPLDRTRSFDLAGALAATASVTLIVWSLIQGPEIGWTSPQVVGPAFMGIVLAWTFTRIELRARDPLVPHVLLRNRFVRLAITMAFMFMATFGSLLYFMSIYLQNVLGYDALETGLGFVVLTVFVVLASALAGWVSTRIGLKAVCLGALSIGLLGVLTLALTMTADASYPDLVPGLILTGVGDGAMFTAMFIAAATGVAPTRQGATSAIVSTGAAVGAAVGLAFLVLLANRGHSGLTGEALRVATADGVRSAALAIAFGIAATLVYVIVRYPQRDTAEAQPANKPVHTTGERL